MPRQAETEASPGEAFPPVTGSVAVGAPVAASALAAADALGAAEDRGRTTVSKQAMERTVARVVIECPGVGGIARRALGLHAEERRGDAIVAARLHGAAAVSLAVRCSVPYPSPVARTTEALRELLMTRVPELTGMKVQRVDITVTDLPVGSSERRVR